MTVALAPAPAVVVPSPALQVDLAAVAENARRFASLGRFLAVVKADAFGHGALDVAGTALANGACGLGVTSLREAFALREAGVTAPLLSWLNPVGADWRRAVADGVEVAVPSLAHLTAVARHPGARVHLHLDVGLARDGAPHGEWAGLCRAARALERRGILRVVGVMGHLPCADQPGHPADAEARARFRSGLAIARAAGLRPTEHHLAATASTLHDAASRHTLSRIGAGLYGIDPAGRAALRPALTLTAPLVSVREVPAGTPVGYGGIGVTTTPTRLGLIPVGYADGLPRRAEGAEVRVAGRRRPLIGRISMDMAVVDLGDAPAVPGSRVTVFGPGDDAEPTVADWARWSGTIEHEILTGLGPRLHRSTDG